MTSQSLYDILGILDSASPEEIKAAHRRKIRTMHPDTGGSEEAAKQVNAAYEILSDPVRRSEYDRSRRGHSLVCPLCDESVLSEDDLMAHIIRHRAEVATAQHVVQERQRDAEAERVRRARAETERTASRAAAAAAAAAASRTAAQPTRPPRQSPQQSPNDGAYRSRLLLAVGVLLVVAAVGVASVVIADTGLPNTRPGPSESEFAAQTEEARLDAETAATTTTTTTTTTPKETLSKGDAQIRDFLILVADLEENDRFVQAVDGEHWYEWTDEYRSLGTEYLRLADLWDRTYLAQAERAQPGFGRMVSHALLRRSDGYRMVYEASTAALINRDADGMRWGQGGTSIEEASMIFEDVWSDLPAQWQPDAGTPGSALDEVNQVEVDMPDPIPIWELVVGDCYVKTTPGESVIEVDRSRCTGGAMEVYWIVDIGPEFEGFPGEDHVQRFMEELCQERAARRFDERPFERWYWYPTADNWSSGSTNATCAFEL